MTLTNQKAPAFAGAQRASKYVEDLVAPVPLVSEVPTEILHSVPEDAAELIDRTVVADRVGEGDLDLGSISTTTEPDIARKGLRGAIAKLGVHVAPGTAERAALERAEQLRRFEETVRQATWTRAVSVLVANPKGGVGKTPTALLLAGTLAAIRGGSVCVMEVSDDPGALTYRSEGTPARGIGELVRDADDISNAGQLAGYTAPQSSFAAVIGSVGSRPRLDGPAVTAAAAVIDDYFAIRVMDSGNQPSSSAFHAAVAAADVLVIPILNAGDAALEAAALLDVLRSAGGRAGELAATAIVVRLQDGRPENPHVVDRVDRILASYGITHIHLIPYDPHIAERGQLTLSKLAPQTRRAFTATAADVVATLKTTVR